MRIFGIETRQLQPQDLVNIAVTIVVIPSIVALANALLNLGLGIDTLIWCGFCAGAGTALSALGIGFREYPGRCAVLLGTIVIVADTLYLGLRHLTGIA